MKSSGYGIFLITSKVLDARRRGATTEALSNTPQGGAIEGNAADDALMVDQGRISLLIKKGGWLIIGSMERRPRG